MSRGGARQNAGRPRVLTAKERERVGRACERVWYWCTHGKRPYDVRPYVLLAAAIVYTTRFARFVSTRRVEAAWKESRALELDPARPLELAYEDARAIDDYILARMLRQQTDVESESYEALYNWLDQPPAARERQA